MLGDATKRSQAEQMSLFPEKERKKRPKVITHVNICSGENPQPGYWNVDIRDVEGVDEIINLNRAPWPWQDLEEIRAYDALEHLTPLGEEKGQENIVGVMEAIWDALRLGGRLEFWVPTTEGRGAFQDPTHKTYWNVNTFSYFAPEAEGSNWGIYRFRAGFKLLEFEQTPFTETGITWLRGVLEKIKVPE